MITSEHISSLSQVEKPTIAERNPKLGDVEDELFTFYTVGQVDVPTMHFVSFLKKAHNDINWDTLTMVWKEIVKEKPVRFYHVQHI